MKNFARDKSLEELIVFRAEEEMPLDVYLLELLNELKEQNHYLKVETLQDFYKHTMINLNNLINSGQIFPGTLFKLDIREAAPNEIEIANNEYTLTISPILETGALMPDIKEYYEVRLSDRSISDLAFVATQGLEMGKYFVE